MTMNKYKWILAKENIHSKFRMFLIKNKIKNSSEGIRVLLDKFSKKQGGHIEKN